MTDTPNASLYAVDPATGALTALPHFTRLAVSEIRNGIGKVEVDYPVYGLNFDLLAATTVEDRDVEVEVWLVGRQEHAVRGILTDTAGDDLAEDSVWRFEGWTLDVLLDEVLVWPQVGTDKQELVLSSNNAGVIVDALIDQAQARGGLVGVTAGFSTSVDSNGDTWANVVTATFSPSATLLDVMQELIEIGMIDAFRLGPDRVLQMWNPDGQGIDRTVTTPPVVFRRGRDLIESPRRHTVRNSATTVLAVGSDNLYEPADDATALARRGRRIEVTGSANSLKDAGSVTAYAQQLLTTITPGTHEVTHGLRVGPGLPIPWVDYGAGDWVWSDTRNTLDRLRIQQLELEYGPAGYAGSVVLNTVVVDRVSAIARKLKRISSGTAVVGTSDFTPEVDDGLAPAQVLGVSASSTAYVGNDGVTWASVQAGWTAVTTNADTSLAGDIAGYYPAFRYTGVGMPTDWQVLGQVSGTLADWSGVVPGKALEVRVAAVDKWGRLGAWSSAYAFTSGADATPPPVPSTPVVDSYLGLLTITWDGLGSVGEPQPVDFDRVDVHVSTSSGFTPSSSTRVDTLRAKGTIPWDGGTYDVTYYGKLVAYDKTGNASAASAQDSATLVQAGDGDIGAVSIGKLTAGIMSAIMTISGIMRTASTGARVQIDNDGIHCYDAVGSVFDFDISTGQASMIGTLQAGTGNDRVVVQPSGAGASGVSLSEISLYAQVDTPAYINAYVPGTGLTGLGLNSGNTSNTGTDRKQTTLRLSPSDFTLFYNTAPGDVGGPGLNRGARLFGSNTALAMEMYNSTGQRRARISVSATETLIEQLDTSGARDGGFAWLRAGNNDTYFGKLSGDIDSYLRFGNAVVRLESNAYLEFGAGLTTTFDATGGEFAVLGQGTASLRILSNTVELKATANNRFFANSGTAQHIDAGVVKTFVIDHPQDDPADPRRYLVHACLEGPTAGVIYRGTAVVEDGLAVVQLPPYFQDLATDDVQVFAQPAIGTAFNGLPVVAGAAVSEVSGGMFHIVCSAPNGTRVSWVVFATRRGVEFDVEPSRDAIELGGSGPYLYATPKAS